MDEEHVIAAVRYVEINPVRAHPAQKAGGSRGHSQVWCHRVCRELGSAGLSLVEAAGIEPASENASAGTATCVAYLLNLASPGSGRQDPDAASPRVLARNAGALVTGQPALATPSSNHAGEVSENVTA
jgi:hypothetical protein